MASIVLDARILSERESKLFCLTKGDFMTNVSDFLQKHKPIMFYVRGSRGRGWFVCGGLFTRPSLIDLNDDKK